MSARQISQTTFPNSCAPTVCCSWLVVALGTGAVAAPPWLCPAAAAACYMLPILILYGSGQLGSDRFHRELAGVTIQERAARDFIAWLERVGIKRTRVSGVVDGCARVKQLPTSA